MMGKIRRIFLTTVLLLLFLHGWTEEGKAEAKIYESTDLSIIVNEQMLDLDVSPIVKNGRTLAPLRAVFEAMGATVNWNKEGEKVSALRDGTLIELTIGSKEAFKNGEKVTLSEPAIIFSERTMVPVRFIGEAFGGIVHYNEKEKIIQIMLGAEKEVHDLKVKLNNTFLYFNKPPISKNKRTYLPIESVFDGLGKDLYWTRENDKITATMEGLTVEMFVNKNLIVKNGEKMETSEYPIDYNGTIMVPIRFIGETFGGIVHYDDKEKVTYIYINRPKFKTKFLDKEMKEIVKPIHVPIPKLVGNRRLMVSDNPELLNNRTINSNKGTLWQDTVVENKERQDHRVFGWHVNQLNENIIIGMTIENLSETNTIKIHDLKGINRMSENGWSNYDVGLPIAETVLMNQLLTINLSSQEVKPGEMIVLEKYSVPKNHTIGFLTDFTVEKVFGTGELNYRIRTVFSKDESNLLTITSDPLPIDRDSLHPRGVWSSSEIFLQLPTYEVGEKEISYNISNGVTDHLMSEETSFDPNHSVKNPGHYGATYQVNIPVINDTGETKTVRVRLAGRGGLYNGAVKTKDGVFITPTLEPMKDVANVIDMKIGKEQEMIELQIMHAGGSALPLAINIMTLD